ncbi:hypothetical protein CAOG_04005 [Capsaspora owczarzaki ATCC 30864]|uniref:hypothetical protein n=1 Tax=Capsaspora owczarzaki (strain ATCC 30864) TaxID=595528 RepID=UPI0001FE3BDD|nr:hypothetical protein CAOG_04005 [Capsaspora owczarzaki ATCC 30864]|eukprot:XP_004347830.1 hypothetical protein CAOG_04005 [Capsaspora owczarzaki ATCC 30864]
MSKNTSSTAYRKVNVDAYDEDNYEDESQAVDNAAQVNARDAEVKKLLTGGNTEGALKAALADPPLDAKDQSLKDKSVASVLSVLTATKTADIAKIVGNLNPEQIDVLMKYVYRGMNVDGKSKNDENQSGILLAWHAAVFAVGGHGSIIRVITDRRSL